MYVLTLYDNFMYLYVVCAQESLHATTAISDFKVSSIFLVSAGLRAVILVVQHCKLRHYIAIFRKVLVQHKLLAKVRNALTGEHRVYKILNYSYEVY